MIDSKKVVGFYTDVFGNEIDEYEQIHRYSVCYDGARFEGDEEGWNEVGFDSWNEAKAFYDSIEGFTRYIHDNAYEVTYSNGEWY